MKQTSYLLLLILLVGSSLALYSDNSKVVKLTSSNFREKVINSKGIWFVEFYAPWCGHCKNLAPTWEKIAAALEGVVNIGAVDMDSDREAGASYGISGFPTLKLFGANKNSPIDYNGGRDPNALIKWALDQAQQAVLTRLNGGASSQQGSQQNSQGGSANSGPSDVVVLTASNFNSKVYGSNSVWLVEFYAPWCGHCKKLQPEWDAAAKKTKGMVNFGKVNCDEEQSLCPQFGVRGYPTIKYFKPNSQSASDAEEYQGGREEAGIVKVATELFTKFGGELELNQIISQDSFKKDCLDSDKNACLIFFLPHTLDSAVPRSKFLNDIQTVMRDFVSYPIVFLWSQGGDQFDFESQFPLGAGFPALLTIVPKKKKYSVMRTGQGFEATHIKAYLQRLLSNSEVVYDLPAVISPMRKVTAWVNPDKAKTN